MKKLLLFSFISAITFSATAQVDKRSKKEERRKRIDAMVKQEEEGVLTYKKHTVYGLKLSNDGYGGFFEIGRAKSIRKSTLFQLEIGERKHEKEDKQANSYSSAPYIYGKQNFFYPIKLGVQQQFLLGNKSNKNGVSVTGNVGGGLIVGLLRPYMVEVVKGNQRVFIAYNSPDSALFLDYQSIVGGPNFGTGWNKLKVTPGVYVKPSLRFDYGRFNEVVSAIETGITAEYYGKKIPQMAFQKQKQFFFSAYVAVLFGRRK
ncbi:MAG: hypothetical protein ABJA78_11805 [Ferruginibacter sp.]